MDTHRPVLIIGGGIAGLVTALSLHQANIPCQVFESVAELRPLGVGINLLPHAVRELTELGLGELVTQAGVATATLSYFSKRGGLIWSEPRGKAAGYHWPQISLHRGQLQMLLYEACVERLGAENLHHAHHLASWEMTDDGVSARFTDPIGDQVHAGYHGCLLLGADGIHSSVRATLYPDEGVPIWNGAVLWRGTTESEPFLGGRTMIMAGHEFQKFVCYPIKETDSSNKRTLINWVAEKKYPPENGWRREDWNRPGDLNEFLPDFEDWIFPWLSVPNLIRQAHGALEYPMVDRDPLPRWSHGRVTLLGDAAHPMYPIGSNGASQAILDARVLTAELLRYGRTPQALSAYEQQRLAPTSRIVLANRGNGPEQVMQLVEERAPEGFARIEDVLNTSELEQTAAKYKQLAGFDKDELNQRPPIVTVH